MEKITPEWVQTQVDAIDDVSGDYESAHHKEDVLYAHILEAIAAGTIENAPECARIALTTQSIDFERHCA